MIEIQELFRKLKPFYGKKIDDLWNVYLMEDRNGKSDIETTLQIMESQVLGKSLENNEPIMVPPPENAAKGSFYLGDVIYGDKKLYPFGLLPKECTSHICITGATGRGKSNICMHFIQNLLREDIKWCLFDFKRSVRDILADPIPYNRPIYVYTVGRNVTPFRFNPLLPPPGLDPRTWIDLLIDLITKVEYAGFGVASLLRKAFDHVYRSRGIYENRPLIRQPTLKEALRYLQDYKTKGREIDWMSSTIRALESLSFGEMGDILNSQNPIDLKEILDRNVIFELDSLSNSNKIFFIESLLTYFHAYRLYQGGDEKLKHVFIVEEAHRLLKKTEHHGQGQDSILDIWVTEARALGEGLVILCQTPSILPAIALGNTYTTICLNLKHSSDINTMSRILLLKEDQKDALGQLKLGRAIVKLQGRWLSPFLIDVPLYPIQKGSVNDEKLKKLMEPYFTDSISKEAQNDPAEKFQVSPENGKHRDDIEIMEYNLSETEKNILMDISKYPGSGVVERYKRLNLSRRKGNFIKQKLINKGLLKEIPLIVKKGRVMLLELTAKGKNTIKNINGNQIERKRTGGATHEFWKDQIARYYESRGLKVIKEESVNGGKTVDLSIENNGKKVAVEIETGRSDALWNIQKDLEAGFDEVISVAVNEEVFQDLKRKITNIYPTNKKVKVGNAQCFL